MAELQQAGLVELMLLKADWSGAMLLLRAADLAAAREAVGSLPLVANGITSVELTEVITPGSLHDGPAPQPGLLISMPASLKSPAGTPCRQPAGH